MDKPPPFPRFDRKTLETFSKDELIDLVLAMQDHIARLEARIDGLERRLAQNSANSSRPPSTDPPGNPALPKPRRKSRRSRGAQPGHPPQWRALLPESDVTRLVDHRPDHCQACGLPLTPADDPQPVRHQFIDLPPIRPEVTEHRCHAMVCSCGAVTRAPLPLGLPDSPFGPGLAAMVATLTGVCHLSRRNALDFVNNALNVPMSLGGLSNCEAQMTRALEWPAEEVHEYVQRQGVAHADETSFGVGPRQKGWLWVMAVPLAMVFALARTRATAAARKLIGAFRGVLVTDRYGAYNAVAERRQVCWAHLGRDFQALSERKGLAGRIGLRLVKERRRMFRLWHRVRDGTLSREKFARRVEGIGRNIHGCLFEGALHAEAGARGTFAELLKAEKWFWTFVSVPGVEPTNNEAERCIRGAVLWRKGSFGALSERGGLYVERMLTVTGTCRKQGRQVYGYLRDAMAAYQSGRKAPSLLPTFAHIPSTCHKTA